jgi:hypothetical protein
MRVCLTTVQDVIVACAFLQNMAIDAKEDEPPRDPEVAEIEAEIDEEEPHGPNRGNATQRQIVEYYRQLLINHY